MQDFMSVRDIHLITDVTTLVLRKGRSGDPMALDFDPEEGTIGVRHSQLEERHAGIKRELVQVYQGDLALDEQGEFYAKKIDDVRRRVELALARIGVLSENRLSGLEGVVANQGDSDLGYHVERALNRSGTWSEEQVATSLAFCCDRYVAMERNHDTR